MISCCRGLIDRVEVGYDNADGIDATHLDAYIGDDDLAAVVARARRGAAHLRTLIGRLDAGQLAGEVPAHVVDGGHVVLDGPMPWGRFAVGIHAGRHLPMHTDQMRALRLG